MTRQADESLVKRCLEGNKEAFTELIRCYKEWVFIRAYATTTNYADAEDLAQEIFIAVYRGLRSLKEPARFDGWFKSIVYRRCQDWIRRKLRRPDMRINLESIPEPAVVATPSEPTEKEDLIQRALAEINKLSEDLRQILILRYLQECSYKKMAELLNIPISAVGERLFRARSKLEELLMKPQMYTDTHR